MNGASLKDFPLLAEFTDEDREVLVEFLEERSVALGRRLFSEDSEAEGLLLLASGEVRVESRRTGAAESMGAGSALGALSLVSLGPHEATAFAVTPCQVLLLPRTSWRRFVEDYPRTACRLAEAVLSEFAGLLRQGLDKLAS